MHDRLRPGGWHCLRGLTRAVTSRSAIRPAIDAACSRTLAPRSGADRWPRLSQVTLPHLHCKSSSYCDYRIGFRSPAAERRPRRRPLGPLDAAGLSQPALLGAR